jgi:hypothetical protein
MPDMMAIVSKAVFDKQAPKAKLGGVLPIKVYRSANKHLSHLDGKSRLFLVTVRPPDETLWLIAVLQGLEFDGEQWTSARNKTPVTNLDAVKGALQFDSGKGLAAKKGALGMSLQTPRVLSEADVALLLRTVSEAQAANPPRPRQPRPYNLAAHEAPGPLPCLCHKCLQAAPESIEVGGMSFFRAKTEVAERILWFWVPADIKAEMPSVLQAVQSRLYRKLKPFKKPDPT